MSSNTQISPLPTQLIVMGEPIHAKRAIEDTERTKALTDLGMKTIRFTNRQVMKEMDHVLRIILESLESSAPFWVGKGLGDGSGRIRITDLPP